MTTDTELRDLLAAEAGGPTQRPAGWDDVTRRGRHRQRTRRVQNLALVAVAAGVAITAIVLSAGDSTVDTGPPATQPKSTALEEIDPSTLLGGSFSGARTDGTSLKLFSGSAHSDIGLCGIRPLVRESDDQVMVGLVGPRDERGAAWAACGDGVVGSGLPAWDVWGAVKLRAPLGDRSLVDLSDGQTVPVTDSADLLFPTFLPAPFDVADFHEANTGLLGGPEDWFLEFRAEAPQRVYLSSSADIESNDSGCPDGQVVEVRGTDGCFVANTLMWMRAGGPSTSPSSAPRSKSRLSTSCSPSPKASNHSTNNWKGTDMRRHLTALLCAGALLMTAAACSDDDTDAADTTTSSSSTAEPTTLARGEVTFADGGGLGGESLDITAEEAGGEVTGDAQLSPAGLAVSFECADTETDGMVVLGGEVTATTPDNVPPVGDRMAVVIWEGDPDRVVLFHDDGASESCEDVLAALPGDIADDPNVTLLADGDDIETA